MDYKIINTPITEEKIKELKAGDMAYINGKIYTARDAAHKRLIEMLNNNEKPPFDFNGQIVYYAGPCPNRPGSIIGPVGPTTSGRMDLYSPMLIEKGLKAMIGKGLRGGKVVDSIKEHTGVYFAAIGGAAALISKCVMSVTIVAFEDLGTEAIRELEVSMLPVVVAIDCNGNSVYSKSC